MAKIRIKFNAAVIKEIEINKDEISFGRKPNNDICLDNPAISGFHGKLHKEGENYYVEDLNSTNGTYLNGQRIKKSALKNKDQIGVARHILEFVTEEEAEAEGAPEPTESESTPSPEKEKQLQILRESLGIKKESVQIGPGESKKSNGKSTPSAPIPAPSSLVDDQIAEETNSLPPAIVKVISGLVGSQSEFSLNAMITYIGTSDKATIKIKGFLAPGMAAAISKRPDGYFLKAVKSGYPKLNGAAISEQALLENGSLIEVGTTTLAFYIKDSNKKETEEKS